MDARTTTRLPYQMKQGQMLLLKTAYRDKLFVSLLLFTLSCFSFSQTAELEKIEVPPPSISQIDWVFSGTVTNESGEHYSYYFQMQRKDTQFHVIVTLIDNQSHNVLLFEESEATIEQPQTSNWRVGRAFLQFNPITNSWIFGAKTKNQTGFNFKVDMLKRAEQTTVTQNLRTGLEFSINQTGPLNGHLQAGEESKEQFVTAEKAWFRKLWVSKVQEGLYPLTSVLCQFNDGSNFYALNVQEEGVIKNTVASWHDGQGISIPISQAVTIKQIEESVWHIRVPSSKIRLSLQDALIKEGDTHQLIAGQTEGMKSGFCSISKEKIA